MSKKNTEETLKKAGFTDEQVKKALVALKEADGSIADCGENPNPALAQVVGMPREKDEDDSDAEVDSEIDGLIADLKDNLDDLADICNQLDSAQDEDDELSGVDDLLKEPDANAPQDSGEEADKEVILDEPKADDVEAKPSSEEPEAAKEDDELPPENTPEEDDMKLPDDLTEPEKAAEDEGESQMDLPPENDADKKDGELGLPVNSEEEMGGDAEARVKELEAECAQLKSDLAAEKAKHSQELAKD